MPASILSHHSPTSCVATFLAVVLFATSGCGANGPTAPVSDHPIYDGPIVVITVLDGDKQEVPAGQQLPQPVRVRVTKYGQPAWAVEYKVVDGARPEGWTSKALADSNGIAVLQPAVGNVPGPFTITIHYNLMQSSIRPAGPWGSGTTAENWWVEAGKVTVTGTVVGPSAAAAGFNVAPSL